MERSLNRRPSMGQLSNGVASTRRWACSRDFAVTKTLTRMMMTRLLVLFSLFAVPSMLTACGDKEDEGTPLDTAPPKDTETVEEPVCSLPTISASYALPWGNPAQYGGYSALALSDRALITDPATGRVYGIPYGAKGEIESAADLLLTLTAYSPDKLVKLGGGYIAVADSSRTTLEGAVGGAFIIAESTLAAHGGPVDPAAIAEYSLTGVNDGGYAGALAIYDPTGDGSPDLVVSTGPIPASLAVFSDIASQPSALSWVDADFTIPVCAVKDRVAYGPTDAAVYGSGFLAVGCPGNGYRGGTAYLFPETLSASSEPLTIVLNVAGWYVAGEVGGPVHLDARGDAGLVTVDANGVSTTTAKPSGADWWGSSPATWTVNGCSYLAVGEPTAVNKDTTTGAVHVALLDESGLPVSWMTLDLPVSGEGQSELLYLGSVVDVSPDGAHLVTSGWQKGSANPGGGAVFELTY